MVQNPSVGTAAGLPPAVPDRDSAPFWAAAGRDELVVQVCTGCGRGVFPPLPGACPFCRQALEWRSTSTEASVYSWIGIEVAIHDAEAAFVPFSVVLAQLTELADVRIPCFDHRPAPDVTMGEQGAVAFSTELGDGPRPVFVPGR
jgi:uncharacterized OB-fold protein